MKHILRLFAFIAGSLLSAVTACAQTEISLADTLRELLDERGLTVTNLRYEELREKDFKGYRVDEGSLNNLGYDYLQQDRLPEALAVFGFYLDRFPNSGNAHDSYAEALVHKGDASTALAEYRRSLELDPKNRNAEAMIAELAAPGGLATLQQRVKLDNEFQAAGRLGEAQRLVALPRLRSRLDEFLRANPSAPAAPKLAATYFRLVESVDLTLAADSWRIYATHPNPDIAELATAKQPLVDAITTPVELKFTGVNGETVDMAQLRGKVVLLDFWATWCGPCIAEIPNVKKAYDNYHAQGFEVVGISLDGPNDRAKLEAFLKERNLPWPQYFDGKAWKTDFAVKYNVRAIPAAFLLDKSGRLVSLSARGPRLEALVRRHLGLK